MRNVELKKKMSGAQSVRVERHELCNRLGCPFENVGEGSVLFLLHCLYKVLVKSLKPEFSILSLIMHFLSAWLKILDPMRDYIQQFVNQLLVFRVSEEKPVNGYLGKLS